MLELPEALTIARQLNESIAGQTVASVEAGKSPHKFAWLSGDSEYHEALLKGRRIESAQPQGGYVVLHVQGDVRLWFGEGTNLRLLTKGEPRGEKHQLLIEFGDGRALRASVAMYGAMYCAREQDMEIPYVIAGRLKPSPLSGEFDRPYFDALLAGKDKLSAKQLLATEQRIPGLGNGVLQDILFCANIHPKRKAGSLSPDEWDSLYRCIRTVLADMAQKNGRDTETDVFGNPGGYATLMSQKTAGKPCPVCGDTITKQAYLGGSVYFCPTCQKL